MNQQQTSEPTEAEILAFLAADESSRSKGTPKANARTMRAREAVELAKAAGITPELQPQFMPDEGKGPQTQPEVTRPMTIDELLRPATRGTGAESASAASELERSEIAAFLENDARSRATDAVLPDRAVPTGPSINDLRDAKKRRSETQSVRQTMSGENEGSSLAKVVDAASKPLLPQIATGGREVANTIEGVERGPTSGEISGGTVRDVLRNIVEEPVATMRGAAAGVVEGAGNVAAQMTSPIDLILNLVPGGAAAAKARGAVNASKGLNALLALTSGSLAARGAERVMRGDTPTDKLIGVAETAGGLAGVAGSRPRSVPRSTGLPVTAPAPAVRVVSPHTETVMEAIGASRRARESSAFRPTLDGLPVLVREGQGPKPPAIEKMADGQRRTAVRLDKFPEEIREDLKAVVERNQGFETQRRGVQAVERTKALADRLAVDMGNAKKAGTALNAEELHAYANAVSTVQDRIRGVRTKVAEGGASDLDFLELQKLIAEHDVVTRTFTGARTEAGRSLNILRQTARVLESHDIKLIRQAMDTPGLRGDLTKLAETLAAAGDDPVKQLDLLRAQQKGSAWDSVSSYFYGNLLSGVKTHERNVIGNAANAISNLASHSAAASIDVMKSIAHKKPREVYFGELAPQVAGSFIGAQRGFKDALFALQHGYSPKLATANAFDLPRKELAGGGKNPWNWPGRGLDAADLFFRSIATQQERYGAAYAKARSGAEAEGLTGAHRSKAIEGRMTDLLTGDGPASSAINAAGDRVGQRSVFQEDPGKVVNGLMTLKRDFPALGFVVPFVRTPANILRQGAEFSPAGFLMKAANSEGREGTQAQGRAALGSLMLAPVAWLSAQGRLSGSGPSDSRERSAKMATGWRPNSLRLQLSDAVAQTLGASKSEEGEYWVSYNLFQPMSAVMSAVANGFEAWEDGARGERSATELGAQIVAKTAQSTYQQSFLAGLSAMLDAVNDPERYGEAFAQQLVTGLVPLSGLQRNITQAVDPVVRKAEGVAEAVQSIVPGLSDNLEPRIDRFGEPITRSGSAIRRGFLVPEIEPTTNDPVGRELTRLEVQVSQPSDRVTARDPETNADIELTKEDQAALRQARGKAVRAAIEATIGADGYKGFTADEQREEIERAIASARRDVSSRARELLESNQRLSESALLSPVQ